MNPKTLNPKTDYGLVVDALLEALLLLYLQAMHAHLHQLMHGLLCCAMLCIAGLYYALLCFATLCCATLCCTMLCCAMPRCAVLCYALLCHAMLCHAMPCCAVLQVARIVGVNEGYIGQRCRGGGAQSDASAKHARFAAACALNAMLCEQSAWTVEQTGACHQASHNKVSLPSSMSLPVPRSSK